MYGLVCPRYKNTVTDDLWDAWSAASGKPVNDVMKGWTLQMGYPLVSVAEGGAGITLSQQRFLSDGSPGEGEWKIPISLLFGDGSSSDLLLEGAEGSAALPAGQWVKVNPGQSGVYRGRYSPELLGPFAPAVSGLSPSDRIGLVGDAFALATAGLTPLTAVLEFLLGFTEETDYTVWSKIAAGLGEVKILLASDEGGYAALKSFIRKLFGPVCAAVGWEKKEGEAHTESLKRALVLKAMGSADDPDTAAVAAEKFEVLKADPNAAVDPDLKLLVYSLAAANGGEAAHATLLAMFQNPETMSEERVRILQSMGSTKDEAVM